MFDSSLALEKELEVDQELKRVALFICLQRGR